jgi:hypothetical protein
MQAALERSMPVSRAFHCNSLAALTRRDGLRIMELTLSKQMASTCRDYSLYVADALWLVRLRSSSSKVET